jgi:uncharacterized protein HemX
VTEEVTEKTISREDTTNAAPKSSSGLWIGIIVLLIVALIAGAGFFIYQQLRSQGDDINKEDQRNIEIGKQVSGFQAQLAAMQTQLTDATSSMSNADERFEQKMSERSKAQEEKLEVARKELIGAVLQIQRQLGKTRGDWLIADAEYLLSVAGQRLHLMGDVETTREALEAADQRLRESGDAAVFKVREEIAKELATLRSVPDIDLVGMYSTLQSLSGRVSQLTLFLPYQGKPVAKSTEHDKHPAPSQTSSALLNAALKQLDGYVTVRHTAQPIKAILTQEEAEFIRQQLSLKLEMIKLALVQKNQPLYHASLEDALAWLDKNFNNNTETQRFTTELRQLDANKLNAQMPDISLSLKMLRDITKLRIETDKALPTVDLEHSLAAPKAEEVKPVEVKPVAVEQPVAEKPTTALPALNIEKPAATTQPAAPAPAATPVATPEVKKAVDAPVPAAQPVNKAAAPVTEVKKVADAPVPAAQPNNKAVVPSSEVKRITDAPVTPVAAAANKTAVTSTTPTPVAEPKKAALTPVTAEKSAIKPAEPVSKTPEKTAQPIVLKPVVVH